jgi:hypothetical protein
VRGPARSLVLAGLLALLAPGGASGEPELELRAAQQEIKLARSHLQAAPGRWEGRRRRALDHLKEALRQVRLALLDAAVAREHGAGDHGEPPARRPRR